MLELIIYGEQWLFAFGIAQSEVHIILFFPFLCVNIFDITLCYATVCSSSIRS